MMLLDLVDKGEELRNLGKDEELKTGTRQKNGHNHKRTGDEARTKTEDVPTDDLQTFK